jgi:endoglucanase
VSACLTVCDVAGHWHYGHYDWCAGQYVNGVADYSPENVAAVNNTYADLLADVGGGPAANFVVDTSRNGVGPWVPEIPPGVTGDPQDWCNPPDRGIGLRPGTETANNLIDAYLWIKIPGESDGECNRWEPRGEPDPVRGMIDPAASVWFPEMALELITYANPEIDLCPWGHNAH